MMRLGLYRNVETVRNVRGESVVITHVNQATRVDAERLRRARGDRGRWGRPPATELAWEFCRVGQRKIGHQFEG